MFLFMYIFVSEMCKSKSLHIARALHITCFIISPLSSLSELYINFYFFAGVCINVLSQKHLYFTTDFTSETQTKMLAADHKVNYMTALLRTNRNWGLKRQGQKLPEKRLPLTRLDPSFLVSSF